MRLKHKLLIKLSRQTGINKTELSDLASGRKRPSFKRAKFLEEKTYELGNIVHHDLWLDGTEDQIKTELNKLQI